jgi:hypothetical protein
LKILKHLNLSIKLIFLNVKLFSSESHYAEKEYRSLYERNGNMDNADGAIGLKSSEQ